MHLVRFLSFFLAFFFFSFFFFFFFRTYIRSFLLALTAPFGVETSTFTPLSTVQRAKSPTIRTSQLASTTPRMRMSCVSLFLLSSTAHSCFVLSGLRSRCKPLNELRQRATGVAARLVSARLSGDVSRVVLDITDFSRRVPERTAKAIKKGSWRII